MLQKKEAVGERIKSVREKLKLTQVDFASLFNTNNSIISKWEKGSSAPNKERLEQIARLGGVTVNWLLYGVDTFMEPIPVYSPFDIMYNDFSTPLITVPYDVLKNIAPDNYTIDENVYGVLGPHMIEAYTQLQLDLHLSNYYNLSTEEKKLFKKEKYPSGYITPLIDGFIKFILKKEDQLSFSMLHSQQIHFYKKESISNIKKKIESTSYHVLSSDYFFVSGNAIFNAWTESTINSNDNKLEINTYADHFDFKVKNIEEYQNDEFGTFLSTSEETGEDDIILSDFTIHEDDILEKYTISSLFPCSLASTKFFTPKLFTPLFKSLSKTTLFHLFSPEIKARIWENNPEIAWSKNDSHFTRKLSDEEFEKQYEHYTNNVYY